MLIESLCIIRDNNWIFITEFRVFIKVLTPWFLLSTVDKDKIEY